MQIISSTGFKEYIVKGTKFYMWVKRLFKNTVVLRGVNTSGRPTFIVDDLVCRYCKDMVTRLVTSINGVSRVNINILKEP